MFLMSISVKSFFGVFSELKKRTVFVPDGSNRSVEGIINLKSPGELVLGRTSYLNSVLCAFAASDLLGRLILRKTGSSWEIIYFVAEGENRSVYFFPPRKV